MLLMYWCLCLIAVGAIIGGLTVYVYRNGKFKNGIKEIDDLDLGIHGSTALIVYGVLLCGLVVAAVFYSVRLADLSLLWFFVFALVGWMWACCYEQQAEYVGVVYYAGLTRPYEVWGPKKFKLQCIEDPDIPIFDERDAYGCITPGLTMLMLLGLAVFQVSMSPRDVPFECVQETHGGYNRQNRNEEKPSLDPKVRVTIKGVARVQVDNPLVTARYLLSEGLNPEGLPVRSLKNEILSFAESFGRELLSRCRYRDLDELTITGISAWIEIALRTGSVPVPNNVACGELLAAFENIDARLVDARNRAAGDKSRLEMELGVEVQVVYVSSYAGPEDVVAAKKDVAIEREKANSRVERISSIVEARVRLGVAGEITEKDAIRLMHLVEDKSTQVENINSNNNSYNFQGAEEHIGNVAAALAGVITLAAAARSGSGKAPPPNVVVNIDNEKGENK
ncbi:MAG: hypothetical protein Q8Q18_00910 [bacterium]|nr:hypothetical protein [bacterium]